MQFSDLGLAEEIVRAVTEHGYTTPTPIQQQAIPAVLAGGDLMAGAQTGTGKTAGFVLPILHRLADKSVKGPSSGRPKVRSSPPPVSSPLRWRNRSASTAHTPSLPPWPCSAA